MPKTKNVLYQELEDSYVKFKSYVYHENFSIRLKHDIADFEENYSRRMNNLTSQVERLIKGEASAALEKNLQQIGYHLMPKKFDLPTFKPNSGVFYSNENQSDHYTISDLNNIMPFINCSIELHILCTYWTVKIGVLYEKKVSEYCYANRLFNLKTYKKQDRLRLFKRYYINYNNWRNSATKKARALHSEGNDVAILNLDIKSYYHSIDLDLNTLRVTKKFRWLNDVLNRIHNTYIDKLVEDKVLSDSKRRIVPIGLISSNILANFYLKDLDQLIVTSIKPGFYGRYVDDILLVFKNPVIDEKNPDVIYRFIIDQLVRSSPKKGSAYFTEGNGGNFNIVVNKNVLSFQLSKVRLYFFKRNDNVSLLEEFEKEIKKNSSEFRLQIEEDELKEPFEDVYQINYSDTINKLRSIERFTTNKFAASKQLSKIISVTKYLAEQESSETSDIGNKLTDYFKGRRALELNILWEKAFIYFIINKDSLGLMVFFKNLIDAISSIQIDISDYDLQTNSVLTTGIYNGMLSHLINSFSAAAALDVNFISTKVLDPIKEPTDTKEINTVLRAIKVTQLKKSALRIVAANLMNHSILAYPLLNYANQPPKFSFTSKRLEKKTNFQLDDQKINLSPRYINFDEVEIFNFIKYRMAQVEDSKTYSSNVMEFNQRHHSRLNNLQPFRQTTVYNNLKVITKKTYRQITIDAYKKINSLRVGLANMKLDESDIKNALENSSNLSLKRLNRLNEILNSCIAHKVQLVIFPEVSIPFAWLSKLSEFSKKNNIAVVCGLEHFVYRRQAYNYVCTILPFRDKWYLNAHVDLRLKIDYSPGEVQTIEELGLSKPTHEDKMRLYNWRNIVFSVFNCFELTDIEKRSLFRGAVDVVFTVEYNKDVNYFSSINESYARDIHAYIIQVNSSDYGDSRVTLPAPTIHKDYIKIKGGENVSLMVGEINIKDLRDFQKLSVAEQSEERHMFKPVPPNYNMSIIRRILS